MTTVAPNLPEQGQLVDVRQRRWVVNDVARSTLPVSPLRPLQEPQHLVTLSSVEDDALGEELQVVWELELGTRVHEKVALPEPTGFDPPARLDAFLDAVRWVAVAFHFGPIPLTELRPSGRVVGVPLADPRGHRSSTRIRRPSAF